MTAQQSLENMENMLWEQLLILLYRCSSSCVPQQDGLDAQLCVYLERPPATTKSLSRGRACCGPAPLQPSAHSPQRRKCRHRRTGSTCRTEPLWEGLESAGSEIVDFGRLQSIMHIMCC